MNLISFMQPLSNFLAYLVEPALRGLLLACVTALVILLMRRKRAVVRLYLWAAVLYAALAMPLLDAFLPRIKLPVPDVWGNTMQAAVPTGTVASPATTSKAGLPALNSTDSSAAVAAGKANRDGQRSSTATRVSSAESGSYSAMATALEIPLHATQPTLMKMLTGGGWKVIAAAVYFVGFAILLARLLLGVWGSRRLANAAEVISAKYFLRRGETEDGHNCAALRLLSSCSSLAGLKHPPALKESAALSVPATVGLRRPVILLPASWRTWTEEKLAAILAHEISHIARGDALTQLFSLVHRAIFWFSPLAWWLNRQLTDLAEQASDEAALAGGADRTLYAEMLLGFFAQLQTVPRRVQWQALSMASRDHSGRAEQRIDRILAWKGTASLKKPFVIGLIALAAPVIFFAASVSPLVVHAKSQSAAPSPTPAPTTIEPKTTPVAPEREIAPAVAPAQSDQETAAHDEKKAEQEEKQSRHEPNTFRSKSGSWNYGPRYVILTGNAKDVNMSGNDEDLQHALALHKNIKSDLIWFEHDEKSYVITNPDFIARAKSLFAPEEELGKKQEELGRQQEELGRQQEALGNQQEKISVKPPDISADLERIHARLKELEASGATQRELGSVQFQLGELQRRVGRLQAEAGHQQSVIGRQQGELGRKQGELGRQQGELGRQQGEIARKASRELRSMFDDAITKGIAKPE